MAKLWSIFLVPLFINIMKVVNHSEEDIDLVLVLICLVCSFVGSSAQLSQHNMERQVTFKEVVAVYTSGVMVALLGYAAATFSGSILITSMCVVIVSYMSLEFFDLVRQGISKILLQIPNAFWQLMYYKYEQRNRENDKRCD